MKKIKNVELKENDSSSKSIEKAKIKKNKKETGKNFEGAVGKTAKFNLAPKKQGSKFSSTGDGDKTKKSEKIQNLLKNDLQNVTTNNKNKLAVQENQKESKDLKSKLENKNPSEERTEAELKKIEKKKAKKLALKLKKKQKKAEGKEIQKVIVPTASSEQKIGRNTKKNVNEESNEKRNPLVNGKQKSPKLVTADNENADATSDGESLKAQQKQAERKLLKDQTQEADQIKTADATSSKVLTKKEKKALKRQLIKDEKLNNENKTRDPAVEAATVFVGNLPVNTKRVQIKSIFKNFGPVNFIRLRSAAGKVLHKHKQRKLAGSLNAYVVLQSKEKAEKALSLNGVEFKGNHLRVTPAIKKHENQDNGEAKKTVFIGNLKYSASEESLREIFSSCGEIEYVRCIRDGDKGCKGVAYVCFKTADAVGLALELNETLVDDRPIHVERYSAKKLGAKKARDAQAEQENKSKVGAKLRLDNKKSKKEKSAPKPQTHGENDDAKKSKKSEFRGVKIESLKKKQKSKKKKSNDQMIQLAKKIAPKPKN